MNLQQLAHRAHQVVAWAAPVILGVALAYAWTVAPGAIAVIATGSAVVAGLITWVVLDYRWLTERRQWYADVRGYAAQADEAVADQCRMIAELLAVHTPWLMHDGRHVVNYDLLFPGDPIPSDHQCTTERVYVVHAGWLACGSVKGLHLIPACTACKDTPWPCPTALVADPDLTADLDALTTDPDPVDAGAASPRLLALAALAVVAALAAWTVVAPAASMDGRGVVAAAVAVALVLAVGARGGRRAVR